MQAASLMMAFSSHLHTILMFTSQSLQHIYIPFSCSPSHLHTILMFTSQSLQHIYIPFSRSPLNHCSTFTYHSHVHLSIIAAHLHTILMFTSQSLAAHLHTILMFTSQSLQHIYIPFSCSPLNHCSTFTKYFAFSFRRMFTVRWI
jgi:hypothetical protein